MLALVFFIPPAFSRRFLKSLPLSKHSTLLFFAVLFLPRVRIPAQMMPEGSFRQPLESSCLELIPIEIWSPLAPHYSYIIFFSSPGAIRPTFLLRVGYCSTRVVSCKVFRISIPSIDR